MTQISTETIETALAQVIDENLQQDIMTAGMVKDIGIEGDTVQLALEFGYPAAGYQPQLQQQIEQCLQQAAAVQAVQCNFSTNIVSHAVQKGVKPLEHVKNIIAVASGKGGVGKSTTAVNLALALQAEGANVGILDADIYGPSQPRMLGCQAKPDTDGKSLEPNVSYKLQSMSIGYLVNEETPMIWRGPMVTSALEQMLGDTNWSDLDYLIIDLPPGTGDIQLTLCQKIPVSGAVIVTTPQDIALLDARKGLRMFEKVEVAVLGIVENMSTHVCSNCGHEESIFGVGGGARMAQQCDVELLGSLPLDSAIREGVDNGRPTVAMQADSDITAAYRAIARKAAARLSLRARDYSGKFPRIVVENA
ncbi:MAG: iron-sulfur cluster carrier protein ApbC [Gammaproteobacteria bacterium]